MQSVPATEVTGYSHPVPFGTAAIGACAILSKGTGRSRCDCQLGVVVLRELPPGLIQGLLRNDQIAISDVVGKAVLLVECDEDGRAKVEFADPHGVIHSIYVESELHQNLVSTSCFFSSRHAPLVSQPAQMSTALQWCSTGPPRP